MSRLEQTAGKHDPHTGRFTSASGELHSSLDKPMEHYLDAVADNDLPEMNRRHAELRHEALRLPKTPKRDGRFARSTWPPGIALLGAATTASSAANAPPVSPRSRHLHRQHLARVE